MSCLKLISWILSSHLILSITGRTQFELDAHHFPLTAGGRLSETEMILGPAASDCWRLPTQSLTSAITQRAGRPHLCRNRLVSMRKRQIDCSPVGDDDFYFLLPLKHRQH